MYNAVIILGILFIKNVEETHNITKYFVTTLFMGFIFFSYVLVIILNTAVCVSTLYDHFPNQSKTFILPEVHFSGKHLLQIQQPPLSEDQILHHLQYAWYQNIMIPFYTICCIFYSSLNISSGNWARTSYITPSGCSPLKELYSEIVRNVHYPNISA